MENSNRYLPLLGRVMIGAPFVLSGLGKLMAHDATVGYIGSVGLPLPQVAWLIALLVEIGGGALLISGFRARPVALIMAVFALGNRRVLPSKFRGSEPDDSFPQERHARGRPPADRLLRRRPPEC